MMDSVKQRILDYVSANQPAKVDLIYKEVGICRNRYYEEPNNSGSWASCAAYLASVCSPEKMPISAGLKVVDTKKSDDALSMQT